MTRSIVTFTAKLWMVCAFCTALNVATSGSDFMALTVKGQKQGEIEGELDFKKGGKTVKAIEVLALNHEVTSPRDSASGLPTGKRVHKPLRVVIKAGRSTPQLFSALTMNENLPTVELTIQRPTTANPKVFRDYMVIKLVDASVSNITTWQPNKIEPSNAPYGTAHEVSFTYRRIEWTYLDGGLVSSDDWAAANN